MTIVTPDYSTTPDYRYTYPLLARLSKSSEAEAAAAVVEEDVEIVAEDIFTSISLASVAASKSMRLAVGTVGL